jgi:hypothetical protein
MYVVSIVVCPFVLFSFSNCVLFFDIRFLIAPLVSSNYSYMKENSFFAVMNVCVVNKYGITLLLTFACSTLSQP